MAPTSKPLQKPALIFACIVTFFVIFGSLLFGYLTTINIEQASKRVIERAVPVRDIGWVNVKTDGMRVEISGTAPDNLASMRVLERIGKAIHIGRIDNQMEVSSVQVANLKTHLEIVQNEQVSSIVGLMPKTPSPVDLYRAMDRAQPLLQTLNLVEDSVSDAADNWEEVLDFLTVAVSQVPRLKITASPEEVRIVAVAKTQEEATNIRKTLTNEAPASIRLALDIDAPRPLIAPFVFTVEKTEEGVNVSECSATNTAELAGMKSAISGEDVIGFDTCQFGLGAPTEQWGTLISKILTEVDQAPTYKVAVSDNQINIGISDQIDEKTLSAIRSDINASLPPGFGMDVETIITLKTIEELKEEGNDATLTIVKSEDGRVNIEGVMGSTLSFDNLRGFAAAKFGTENLNIVPEVIEGLPSFWEQNSFEVVEAISPLISGEAVLSEKQLTIVGRAASQQIVDDLEQTLSADTRDVVVSTDFEIVPQEQVVSSNDPSQCIEELNLLLTQNPIQFETGSANISDVSKPTIVRLGQVFYDCREFSLEIGGHTDNSGSAETNQQLSQERAQSVLEAVQALALDLGKISARGYGASDPIASNETEEGRARNRRIEIRLLDEDIE